jgi:hypothetical protein
VALPNCSLLDYLSSSGLQQYDRYLKFDFDSFAEVILLLQRVLQGKLHETIFRYGLLAPVYHSAQDLVHNLDAYTSNSILVHPRKRQFGGRDNQKWIWAQLFG